MRSLITRIGFDQIATHIVTNSEANQCDHNSRDLV